MLDFLIQNVKSNVLSVSRPHSSLIFNPCHLNPCYCDDHSVTSRAFYQFNNVNYKLYGWWTPIKDLGRGPHKSMCSVKDTRNGREYAVTKYCDVFSDWTEAQRIVREIKLMQHMDHPNIMGLVGCVVPERQEQDTFNDIYIVMERCDVTYVVLFRAIDPIRCPIRKSEHSIFQITTSNPIETETNRRPCQISFVSNCTGIAVYAQWKHHPSQFAAGEYIGQCCEL